MNVTGDDNSNHMEFQRQLSRLGLFDAKVPRYTSYPTAPHFSDAVDGSDVATWIKAIPVGSKISLYVHIPFCRRLCWFCACRTQGTSTLSPVAAYMETLKTEISHLAAHLPKGVTLSRLHWGGGTPTLLEPAMMLDLADHIRALADFASNAEFSVEIDPTEIDQPRVDALAQAGMTRASIGVQDFDPQVQEVIGRIQGHELTRDAVEMIRSAGISSLNADILYGLPHQDTSRMTETVQKLLDFTPDRVALYGYAHVPWMAKRQQLIPTAALPTPQERLKLFDTARRLFVWDGYAEIGIDHFARPEDGLALSQAGKRMRRNFQGYTDDSAEVLIGLGASAISRFPQGYAQNAPATSVYQSAIRAGGFATTRGHVLSAEDNLNAFIIERIMCDFALNSADVLDRFDINAAALQALLKKVADQFENLIEVDGDGLRMPREARPLTRMVARAFDTYDLSKAGHSSAI